MLVAMVRVILWVYRSYIICRELPPGGGRGSLNKSILNPLLLTQRKGVRNFPIEPRMSPGSGLRPLFPWTPIFQITLPKRVSRLLPGRVLHPCPVCVFYCPFEMFPCRTRKCFFPSHHDSRYCLKQNLDESSDLVHSFIHQTFVRCLLCAGNCGPFLSSCLTVLMDLFTCLPLGCVAASSCSFWKE